MAVLLERLMVLLVLVWGLSAKRQGEIKQWIHDGGGDPSLYNEQKYGRPDIPITINKQTFQP